MSLKKEKILVIGGAGYVGSMLVNKLLNNNYDVGVLDLFIYGSTMITNFILYYN